MFDVQVEQNPVVIETVVLNVDPSIIETEVKDNHFVDVDVKTAEPLVILQGL